MKIKINVLLLIILLIVLTAAGCGLFTSEGENVLPTTPLNPTETAGLPTSSENVPTTEAATETPVPAEPTQGADNSDVTVPTEGVTDVPEVTATDAPDPTAEPTPTPTATPVPTAATPATLSQADAAGILQLQIGTAYTIAYVDELRLNGEEYFEFTISDETQTYSPNVIIHVKSGEIFYFYSEDEVVEFANFPPDKGEDAGQTGGEEFTREDALALLMTLTPEELSLPKALAEYKTSIDSWTSMINMEECYCINVYEDLGDRQALVAMYYVTVDGSSVYQSDMGEFILIH